MASNMPIALINTATAATKLIAISAAALLSGGLMGCAGGVTNAGSGSAQSNNNCSQQVGQSTNGKAVEVCFPDQDKAWLKNGTYVNVENLRRMNVGMNENQVRELISYPHFSEGFLRPSVWNYVFNFRTGAGREYMTCQYQVQYKDGLTANLFWNKPGCADVLTQFK